MPIVPYRANFTELITDAALQRKTEKKEDANKIHDMWKEAIESKKSSIRWLTHIKLYLDSEGYRIFHMLWFGVALIVLAMETLPLSDTHSNSLAIVNMLVDIFFLCQGFLTACCTIAPIVLNIMDHNDLWGIFLRMGILDILLAVASLLCGSTVLGTWFRLVRVMLISLFSLRHLEHIDVLIVSTLLPTILDTYSFYHTLFILTHTS